MGILSREKEKKDPGGGLLLFIAAKYRYLTECEGALQPVSSTAQREDPVSSSLSHSAKKFDILHYDKKLEYHTRKACIHLAAQFASHRGSWPTGRCLAGLRARPKYSAVLS